MIETSKTMFFRQLIHISAFFLAITVSFNLHAKENIDQNKTSQQSQQQADYSELVANCDNPSSQFDLKVNNVNARIHNGGDMWWDLVGNPRYEIPKDGGVHSMFASAVWIGGVDAGGQLKVAAQTYRQSGVDFWAGPLDGDASITRDECSAWDDQFVINRGPWIEFINDAQDGSVDKQIPKEILEWPAKGNPNITLDDKYNNRPYSLAPFEDVDNNGIYEPSKGDYPILADKWEGARPDQMIWWVYNDKGDIHTETNAQPIGIEVQATAFAFKTNDALNDMTFYHYKLINRGSTTLDSAFIAQWVDPDLGAYDDDYVGCDTTANLGICYNGDAVDGPTTPNYGSEVPMVGVDFFEGPEDPSDTVNGKPRRLGMSSFLYYNNDFSITGNPTSASHYYGYMTGSWKDGTPFTCGGNGYGGNQRCKFMFPGDPNKGGWSECSEGNQPSDRRFLQSSGPFVLQPGAVNDVTVGVVWVPDQNYPCPSFDELKIADQKAQGLFDNGFELISGPDAPTINIREMNEQLVLALNYEDTLSNNFAETYKEVDPTVKADVEKLAQESGRSVSEDDSFYTFQGYKLYQVKDQSVSVNDLNNPDKARLIAQVDRRDSLAKLVNWTENTEIGELVPELKVNGNNEGITRTFNIKRNQFATGDQGLVNHQTYYFTVVAYGANRFRKFSPNDSLPGQQLEYLEGLKNVKIYSAKPHMIQGQKGGMRLNAQYGDAPEVTRLEGQGNGGRVLQLTDNSVNKIIEQGSMNEPVYKANNAPVKVMIYDPTQVPDAKFRLAIKDSANMAQPGYKISERATWELTNLNTGKTVTANRNMAQPYEQIIPEWGLVIEAHQVPEVDNNFIEGGMISAERTFEDGLNDWLTGISDAEGRARTNWIRAGSDDLEDENNNDDLNFDDYIGLDNQENYEDLLNRSWAPYQLCNHFTTGEVSGNEISLLAPALDSFTTGNTLNDLASVKLVLTADKDKWTKCVVVEMKDNTQLAENGAPRLSLRRDAGWSKDGSYSADTGRSWFPGYAINKETGERLNIMFGEDSWRKAHNGGDMIWNPTTTEITFQGERVYGGQHFIYVMESKYDGGNSIYNRLKYHADESNLNSQRTDSIRSVYHEAMWVGAPLLDGFFGEEILLDPEDGIIPTKTTIDLNVTKPYRKYAVGNRNSNLPLYEFSLSDFAVETGLGEVAKNALDSIRVVPNPYNAHSLYEDGQLDREVKITNLPPNTNVEVYTVKGTLVREFSRSVGDNTSAANDGIDNTLSWDLTNQQNVPIASGLYLIRVEAPGLGERVLKFFCVMRPTDLSTF
jgi:hypothetical protein